MNWFGGKTKDEKETERLILEADRLKSLSLFQSSDDVRNWIIELLTEVCTESDLCITSVVAEPLYSLVRDLLASEPFLYEAGDTPIETLKQASVLRLKLRRVIKILGSEAAYLAIWRHALKCLLLRIVEALPVNALCDPAIDGSVEPVSVLSPTTPLYTLVDNLPLVLTQIMGTLCAPDLGEAELFQSFGYTVDRRLCAASGIAWEDRYKSKRKMVLPIEKASLSASELVTLYLTDTLFDALFRVRVPIPIPAILRFEHMHIVGGTGAGKTQLLQYLLMADLDYALQNDLSLVVFDPDGTLIKTITHTDYFGEYLFRDRAIFIDPSDTEYPVSLNLFDVPEVSDKRTREAIQNNTIELFEYFFDALLGSELTGKQSTLFRYLAILLMEIPNGNIHTLRELMEDGVKYKPYMEKLSGSARDFFLTRFFAPDLKATKTQVLQRLWGVLSNRALDRILSGTRNSVNFDVALQSGKMIFIAGSKDYLGEEGSHIFGRLLVALLGQALLRQASISPESRTPVHIYIDEAEGLVDNTLVRLLAQARKYKAGITIAHQHLDQLSSSARAGLLTNTSLKLVAGVSVKDATVLAPEMRTTSQFILGQRKDTERSQFALFAKNITPSAMSYRVPLGYAEDCDRLSNDDYLELIEASRERCGQGGEPETQIESAIVETITAPPAPLATQVVQAVPLTQVPKKSGGGGARHSEIERHIQEVGGALGFRCTLEESVLDGEGRIDAVLRRDDLVLAFEVSVTTTREHEYLNVEKCHRFEASHVFVVAANERHRVSLERFIAPKLTDIEREKTSFLTPEQVESELRKLVPAQVQPEKLVKGWKVVARETEVMRRVIGGYLSE